MTRLCITVAMAGTVRMLKTGLSGSVTPKATGRRQAAGKAQSKVPSGRDSDQQGRRNGHNKLVLDHVSGQQLLRKQMKRRQKRQRENRPSGPKASRAGAAAYPGQSRHDARAGWCRRDKGRRSTYSGTRMKGSAVHAAYDVKAPAPPCAAAGDAQRSRRQAAMTLIFGSPG